MLKRFSYLSTMLLLLVALLIPSASGLAASQVNLNATLQVILADPTLTTNVDVWVDGALTAQVAIQKLFASGFITVPGGVSHTVTLTQAGLSTPIGSPFTFTPNPGPHSDYSLILLTGATWLTPPISDIDTIPAPGIATARVINLASNNTPVTVTVDSGNASQVVYSNVAYPTASPTYISFPAGQHVITIPGATLTKTFIDENVYSIIVFQGSTAPKLYLSTEFSFLKASIFLPEVSK